MFRALFLAILSVTLTFNIIFLFATPKDKPPDVAGSVTLFSVETPTNMLASSSRAPGQKQRRLFLRSNDFYDYSPTSQPLVAANEFEVANENENERENENKAARVLPKDKLVLFANANKRLQQQHAKSLGGGGQSSVLPAAAAVAPSLLVSANKRQPLTTFAYDNYNNSIAPGGVIVPTMSLRNASLAASASDNEIISRPSPPQPTIIRLRVKSSRRHVLVSLDDSIIYQSGTSDDELASWALRKRRRYKSARGDANSLRVRRKRRRRTTTLRNQQSAKSENSPENQVSQWAFEREHEKEETTTTSNEDELERGIHVLVLNQFDASIMSKRLFDTYTSQQDAELALYLNQIKPGRILVLAVRDEASFKMAPQSTARRLLKALGSQHINQLAWRDMWAMVAIKRDLFETNNQIGQKHRLSKDSNLVDARNPLAEAISHSSGFAQWGEPVEIETSVELQAGRIEDECPNWKNEAAANKRRRSFCSRIEGYGRVCDCLHPSPIEFAPRQIADSRLDGSPIVVIASNRPHYLHRMLRSLLEADGVNASMVTVFIDGFHEEPAEVCKLFNLRYIQHKPRGFRAARISNHYKVSLGQTFGELFPQTQHAIIFEEDLDVARDALLYFHATLPLLESDPSLYCVSAWNDQGYEHSVGNLSQLYRVETMPGLGWMLSRDLFVRELQPNWPGVSQQHDWDMWIRTQLVRRQRECLIPDVSRTYHFGSRGTNINAYFQRQYFSKHAFSGNYLDDDDQQQQQLVISAASQNNSLFGVNLEALSGRQYDAMLERIISQEARWIGWSQANDSSSRIANESLRAQMELQYLCSLVNLTHYLDSSDEVAALTDNRIGNSQSMNLMNNNNGARLMSGEKRMMMVTDDVRGRGRRTNVIFVKMIDSEDFANWLQLAKCWRLWDLDARGQHKSTWRLYLNGQSTLVVGYPASPFSHLKPAALVPFDLKPISATVDATAAAQGAA